MRIYLVRHGESMGNVDKTVHRRLPDHAIPLSDRGVRQAKAAGKAFWDQWQCSPFRLWTSPYTRARQTADAFLEVAKPKFGRREHILLAEQQFGLFDGLSDEELAVQYPAEYAHYEKCASKEGRFWARMPLGESRFDVAQRVHQAFGTFHRDAERHGIQNIVVIAHGTTIRAFVMQWLHLPYEWFEREPNPRNCSIRLIDNGKDEGYIHPGGGD